MSQQMIKAKETVEKIINSIEAGNHTSKKTLIEQLNAIDKLIAQNQGKIWLRTKSGKPMAKRMEIATANALAQLETESIDEAIEELMSIAKEIDEESQQRSMVVT